MFDKVGDAGGDVEKESTLGGDEGEVDDLRWLLGGCHF